MTAAEVVEEMLELATAGLPTAVQLRERFGPRAKAIDQAGPNLVRPAWAHSVRTRDDLYLTLDGDLAGIHLWDDSRGWGAYAEIFANRATLPEIEPVTGPTSFVPRNPDDFDSGETRAAYVERAGKTVRIFVELTKDGSGVHTILVHFQR